MRSSPLVFPVLSLALAALTPSGAQTNKEARLWYFGRATVKIVTASGFVIYIDPYAPGDYSTPADLVLVTHGHGDHNDVKRTTRKASATIIAPEGAVKGFPSIPLAEGEHRSVGPVEIEALPAANKNHPRGSGVGYLLSFDGIVLYHSGDTSYIPEMESFSNYHIGWALVPCDGYYNMGPEEASRAVRAMKAKRLIPIHSSKDGLFDAQNARAVAAEQLVVLEPGQSVKLVP